ncbi:MAG TPA: hypothetical protein VKH37_11465, partial [Ferruginibacter sp.]|nr:hypothetical protein [Ferruginibacter sp.]
TMPQHNHTPNGSISGGSDSPANNFWGNTATGKCYVAPSNAAATTNMANAIGSAGGSQPHDNMIPYTCINYIISLYGVYPSPN